MKMVSYSNSNKLLQSLEAPAYSIAETSRLVGIPHWSVNRYLRGYEYKYFVGEESFGGHQPPVISQSEEDSAYASFLDLADLLIVKEFLERGFPLQYLRRALAEAKKYLGTHHFARSEFYTSGNEIVLKIPQNGALIALMTGGQTAIPEVIKKLSRKLDFENTTRHGFAQRFYPRGKNGSVVIDPQISFGRPTLIGYSVATSTIYDLYLGEKKRFKPVSDWFDIPISKIRAAVQFEHSLWA